MIRNTLSILFILLLNSTLLFSQKAFTEQSPFHGTKDFDDVTEMWEVYLTFDATAVSGSPGNAGAEFDGTYFYTTRWASNLIHKYDINGMLVEEFSIPGVSGLRDLTFDGTYMYGGAASNTIYQMDFTTKTLIGIISSPVAVRFIAYDEQNDAFWCGSWADDPTLVNRNGTSIASFSTGLEGQYGAAYDNVSAGGPFLWIFDQGAGAGLPQFISQWDISTGTATGIAHDVMTDVGLGNDGGIAGGLFSTTFLASPQFFIGGLLQGEPDIFFVYDISACSIAPPSDPNPPDMAMNVQVTLAQLSWVNSGGAQASELYFGTDPDSTVLVQSGSLDSLWNIDQGILPLEYFNTYYWKIVNSGTACGTTEAEWSFTTEEEIPVEFTSFTAEAAGGEVVLNWSTSTETNNRGFEIERSDDNRSTKQEWLKAGFIKGAGTSAEPNSYSFTDRDLRPGKYRYRLRQIDFDGTSEYSGIVKAEIIPPGVITLEQNYPNPFNPQTTISYELKSRIRVKLIIFNTIGEVKAVLLDGEKEAGHHRVIFTTVPAKGSMPSGVYFYQLRAGDFVQTKKMILLR